MKSSAIVIPSAVTVYGLLVESEELLSTSALIDDERTLGFQVAKHINEYQVLIYFSENYMLILSHCTL